MRFHRSFCLATVFIASSIAFSKLADLPDGYTLQYEQSYGSKSAFDAILWAGSGGERGGEAITRLLFGLDVPSGRLPITMYTRDVDKLSLFDMNMRPSQGYAGRTYRFHSGPQVFERCAGVFATVIEPTRSTQYGLPVYPRFAPWGLRCRIVSAPTLRPCHD